MRFLDGFGLAAVFGLEGATQDLYLGAVGLAAAASLGAWCELALLRRALWRRLPGLRLPVGPRAALFGEARARFGLGLRDRADLELGSEAGGVSGLAGLRVSF